RGSRTGGIPASVAAAAVVVGEVLRGGAATVVDGVERGAELWPAELLHAPSTMAGIASRAARRTHLRRRPSVRRSHLPSRSAGSRVMLGRSNSGQHSPVRVSAVDDLAAVVAGVDLVDHASMLLDIAPCWGWVGLRNCRFFATSRRRFTVNGLSSRVR